MVAVKFLAVPLKKTNNVDFVKALRPFINSMDLELFHQMEVEDALKELDQMRNQACCNNQNFYKTEQSLHLIERYYDQLCAIQKALPMTPYLNTVAFKWRDAFDKRKDETIDDSAFERVCVLFNCGAVMSIIASYQSYSEEHLKIATKLFQKASGVFKYLEENIFDMTLHELTPDFNSYTLSILSCIMLAQAQECAYLKAVRSNMEINVLIKIANQGSQFYKDALSMLAKNEAKGIFDKEWITTVSTKAKGLESSAHFHASTLCEIEGKAGEQICRVMEAVQLRNQMKSSVYDDHFPILREAAKNLQKIMKANQFIYERVPAIRDVPELEKKAAVKPTPIEGYLSTNFKDLFEVLDSLSINKALSAFQNGKIATVDTNGNGHYPEHPTDIDTKIASLTLSNAFNDVSNHEKRQESIQQKSTNVQQRLNKFSSSNSSNVAGGDRNKKEEDRWEVLGRKSIYFEKQRDLMCGQHALNMLLQSHAFNASHFARFVERLDQQEMELAEIPSHKFRSENGSESGFYSIQVLQMALLSRNLNLENINKPNYTHYMFQPENAHAFIINKTQHWFTLRRFGDMWFILNSLLNGPQYVATSSLQPYLAWLIENHSSIYVVEGELGICAADNASTKGELAVYNRRSSS